MQNEKANLEYWLGQATGRKIQFHLSKGSTLMRRKGRNNYYGMKVTKAETTNILTITPEQYSNGETKNALHYKIIKVSHNL